MIDFEAKIRTTHEADMIFQSILAREYSDFKQHEAGDVVLLYAFLI